MSTVPEVIAARHANLSILALSLITNKVVVSPYFDSFAALQSGKTGLDTSNADKKEAANHEEVLEVGKQKAEVIKKLVQGVVLEAGF